METYVGSAAAALAAEGVEVSVITQAPRSAALPRQEMRDGYAIERHRLPVTDIYDVPSLSAARAASKRGRFDVVWLHSYHTPLAWLAAEQVKGPMVLTPHYHGVGHTPVRHALHRAYRPAGRRLMAMSRRIVVDTDSEASLVLRHFAGQVQREQIAIIPPVVTDPTRGQQRSNDQSNIVLTVARQEPYKRTDLLVRAVALLNQRRISARLVVVGDGSALAAYRGLAARLGVEHLVTFTGSVDDETLGRWWASASVYASASLQEAYGIGLAGALSAGLPVVASAIPAHCEVISRAGPDAATRLCGGDVSDAEAASRYANAIVELLSLHDSREKRAIRCSLPSSAEVVEQLLETLTAASERARM
ncbi:glycosyltransferase family 4 protein [Mycolicibacterium hippocampi]|nr:glycosyltransferase family 4 protein [Mycolicibacterium hippocampi]